MYTLLIAFGRFRPIPDVSLRSSKEKMENYERGFLASPAAIATISVPMKENAA